MDFNLYLSGMTHREIPFSMSSRSSSYYAFYCLKDKGFSLIRLGLCKKRSFSSGSLDINNNSNSISISTISKLGVKTYENPEKSRELIRKDNYGKTEVYCWFNKVNGKFYIGSDDVLYNRLSDYYQDWYYLSRVSTYIVRALLKHGMNNFSLIILEYTTSEDLIRCEQKWIDLLRPEYNLAPQAGNSKGYVHIVESKEKIRSMVLGRKHSDIAKKLMSESLKELTIISMVINIQLKL